MSVVIEVEGERFEVRTRTRRGHRAYDFTWLNGPADSSYGFTLGMTSTGPASPGELSRTEIEDEARLFVRAFFSPDGIGPSDFPEFVASRRGS
jgi:hypothetical protein